jgi:type I restriction enzyme S subunit
MILAHTFPVALTQNEVTINQDMKGITPIKQTNPEYLFLVFKNMQNKVLSYIKEATHGTLRLEMPLIQTIAVPLPPLEEQKEIVRQVDNLFTLADKLEAHFQNAKARIDKLSQSVLAKAFRGELVPQDPDDESAEKLLERIMEEKAKMEEALKEAKKKGGRKKAKAGSRK